MVIFHIYLKLTNGSDVFDVESFAYLFSFRALGSSDLARITVMGARPAYEKHKDTAESKGVRAHFHLDESSLLTLDRVRKRKRTSMKSFLFSRSNSFLNETKLKPIEIIQMTTHQHYQVNSLDRKEIHYILFL